MLTFFGEDTATHNLVYANADPNKANQNNEVIAFCDHWRAVSGQDPRLLVFDSKLTTQAELAKLDDRGVSWLTLRVRTPKLIAARRALPADAWTSVTIDRAGATSRRVRVIEDEAATLSRYPRTVRQLAVAGLGHDEPTILVTNNRARTTKALIECYAGRMNIEQRLAEGIRSFHLDALSSAVNLNVDLDVVLSVLRRRRMRRATPSTAGLHQHHARHRATPVPGHRRAHPHHHRPRHRPAQPPHLLTRPPPGRPRPSHPHPLVGEPDPPL